MPEAAMRIAVERREPATVKLSILGKINGAGLGELRREIERARRNNEEIAIDLSEVTLVDRHSLTFLVEQSEEDVRLINLPVYLERWVERAKSTRAVKERS